MAWLWSSFNEFKNYVSPIFFDKSHQVELAHFYTHFENINELFTSVIKLSESLENLKKYDFENNPQNLNNKSINQIQDFVSKISYYGESILFYHKRLAQSRWAVDFMHEKNLIEHWNRYSATKRIYFEIDKLIRATERLLEGYHEFISEDREFFINQIELPETLMKDFIIARNLFSAGFDDVSVLIAGRGLEGILREIAKKKEIKISQKDKESPACEADFYDLIEVFYRLRWKKDKTRFITPETKTLLHFLRTLRNSTAHSNKENKHEYKISREIVVIISQTVNELWSKADRKRVRLLQKTIDKKW